MFKILFLLTVATLSVNTKSGFLRNLEDELVFQASLTKNVTLTNLTDFFLVVDGFSTAVGLYSDMPSLQACKVSDFNVVQDTVVIIEKLVNGDTSTIDDDIKGLVDTLYTIYKTCDIKGLPTQFLQVVTDVKNNFTQADYVKKFLSQLQSNIFQLMADLKSTVDKYNNRDFQSFGTGLGNLVRTLFVVKSN